MLKYIIIVCLSLISAILYRLGGIGKPFNTKYRDFGCALTQILTLILLGYHTWWHILGFGLMFGTLTTYCKFPGQSDVKWYNWLLTGLLTASAIIYIPIVYSKSLWPLAGIRALILGISTMLWSCLIDKDWLEEGGRGFLLNITLLLVQ